MWGEGEKKWQKMHERRLNEGDSLLTCEGKKKCRDGFRLIIMHLSEQRRRTCCHWQCGRMFFLRLLSGSEREELNTSACLSSLRPDCRQTRTRCRQEKSIITPLCVTVYRSHSVTLSLTDPSLRASVHVRTHGSTLMVWFHSCFLCTAFLVCVCVCVSDRLSRSLPSIIRGY